MFSISEDSAGLLNMYNIDTTSLRTSITLGGIPFRKFYKRVLVSLNCQNTRGDGCEDSEEIG